MGKAIIAKVGVMNILNRTLGSASFTALKVLYF